MKRLNVLSVFMVVFLISSFNIQGSFGGAPSKQDISNELFSYDFDMGNYQNSIPSGIPFVTPGPGSDGMPSGIPSGIPSNMPIPSNIPIPDFDTGPEVSQEDIDALFVLPSGAVAKAPTIEDFSKKPDSDFDKQIEEIVFNTIEKHLATITPAIKENILGSVKTILLKISGDVGIKADASMEITAPVVEIDLSQIPDASVIDKIPAQNLEKAKALARNRFMASLKGQIEKVINEVKSQSDKIVQDSLPQIKSQIIGILPEIIKSADEQIDNKLSESIETEIAEKLQNGDIKLPSEYEGMTDAQLSEKAKAIAKSIFPRVEALIRNNIKDSIKEEVNSIIADTVEKPLSKKFGPDIDSMTESLISSNLSKVPSYTSKLLPSEYISQSVRTNLNKIKEWIPKMIKQAKDSIFDDINTFIDSEISSQSKVYIEGKVLNMDVKPRMVNNRLLVPFRAIAETLGAAVSFDAKTKTVTMKKDNTEVKLVLGSSTAVVNGKSVKIDVPASSIENRTMVPVRFLSETFGLDVEYEPNWKMVKIE